MKTLNFTILLLLLITITQLVSNEQSNETLNLNKQNQSQRQIQIIKGLDNDLDLEIPDSTQVQIVTIDDGSTLRGRIIEIGDEKIKFKTKHGIITISVFEITSLELILDEQIKNGEYWYPNPNSSRLFFAPTGRMLKQGEGYFADYYIFFPTLTLGITNNITIGGGVTLIPGLGPGEQALFFTPKVGIKTSKKMDLAIGALAVKLVEDAPSLGILYGVSTYGSLDKSITLGLGYGYFGNKLADKPFIVLGGEIRTHKTLSLVTENWSIPGVDVPLISLGLRFIGENESVDFALIFTSGNRRITPYIDFVYKFKLN